MSEFWARKVKAALTRRSPKFCQAPLGCFLGLVEVWRGVYKWIVTKEIFVMKNQVSRRSFIKGSSVAAGVLAAAPFNILHAQNSGDKVRFVQVGCGGRGFSHLGATVNEQFVGAVDVDDKRHVEVQKWAQGKGKEAEKIQMFKDYRQMFDKLSKGIDAVFIATPNHQHAIPAMIAMQL